MAYQMKVLRPFELKGERQPVDKLVTIASIALMTELRGALKAELIQEVDAPPEETQSAVVTESYEMVVLRRYWDGPCERMPGDRVKVYPRSLAMDLYQQGRARFPEPADAETETATDSGPAETADAVARRRPSRAEAPAPAAPDTPDSPEQAG